MGEEASILVTAIGDFSKEIQGSVSNQSEGLNQLSKKLNTELATSLGNLDQALSSLTDKFRRDYESFLMVLKGLHVKG